MYLPEGPTRPTREALDAFWEDAREARTDAGLGESYSVRWIGLDPDSTARIIDLIREGDKTGTFTLPWIVEHTDQPEPKVGDDIILIAFDGTPTLLVKLTEIRTVRFGDTTAADIAIDGTPVRDLAVWKPLHTAYWNSLLEPFGRAVSDDMPFWAEPFALIYDRDQP